MFWKYDDEEEKVVPREKKSHPGPAVNELEALESPFPTYFPEDDYQNSDETGAEERFENRVAVFKKEDKPVYKHHFWWFVHNCLAHPAIGIYPCKNTFDFHDWTSKKINGK